MDLVRTLLIMKVCQYLEWGSKPGDTDSRDVNVIRRKEITTVNLHG